MEPGTPTPSSPYYGKEYASHAMPSTIETIADDTATFIQNREFRDDPFTGDPDRSNLMYSASGNIPQGVHDARTREDDGAYDEEISQLSGVVAASTPARAVAVHPAPSRAPPAAPAAAKAAEMMRELDDLAAGHPQVSSMLRAWGYKGSQAPSLGSGGSSSAATTTAGPFFGARAGVQGELLHQRDERARAERQERARLRVVKKASKATLKSQKSVGGGEGGGGLFGRFRRGEDGPSG
jgi:hypothetical protein